MIRALAGSVLIAAALSVAPAIALAAGELDVGAPATPVAAPAGGVIVQWAPGAGRDDRLAASADAEVSFERGLGQPGLQLLELDADQSLRDAVATLRADDATRVVEPDRLSFPHAVPNDPFLGYLWGLSNPGGAIGVDGFVGPLAGADIGAVRAWDRTVGTPSTAIAIIDSGYRFNHPDLAAVAWANPGEIAANGIDDDSNGRIDDVRGYDFVGQDADNPTPDNDPTDSDLLVGGHGVHVAGTAGAAGNDGVGITGVAQNARIMPLRVCAHSPAGSAVSPPMPRASCPDSAMIQAIDYAGRNGARVANLSLGRAGSPSQAVIDAFARNPGTLYVVSAGNDNANNDGGGSPPAGHHYPCDYDPVAESTVPGRIDNIVCVAATDQADERASFSDYGAVSVDLAAPGTETLSSYPVQVGYTESFSANDFASKWVATAANGFARGQDGPLTSFGMTDSPGAAPAASTAYESTLSSGFALPSGYGSCKLSGSRFLSLGSGSFTYSVLSNGTPAFSSSPGSTSGSEMANFSTQPIQGLAGTTVTLRFRYTSDSSPAASEGAWLDDLEFECYTPPGSSLATYTFLQGTSMAAPHVAGAAGLLFSLKPAATVTEVRGALLSSVDPLASLSGLVATGGRLNVADALDAVVAPPPPTQPGGGGASGPGPGPGPPPPPPAKCKVPKLKGLSLGKATVALKKASCALGKVTKPKRKKGQKKLPALVVKSSKPKAGAELAANAKVAVTLGPKPKPKPKKKRKKR